MLELESVHIPKTAGMTFFQILRHWYGEECVARHNIAFAEPVVPETRVMHGHFPAGTYNAERRICWVRDPARRLVSHYAYLRWQQPPMHEGRTFELQQRLWHGKMEFEEFVRHPQVVRGLAQWFNGVSVDDFDFVGIQEDIDRELIRCAHILDKPVVTIDGGENLTIVPQYAEFKRTLTEQAMDALRAANPECMELYQQALELAAAWWEAHPKVRAKTEFATAA